MVKIWFVFDWCFMLGRVFQIKVEEQVPQVKELASIPKSRKTTSFRYRLSPRELILIAGNFPDLPQRLMVKGETRRSEATSLMVKRSGRSERLTLFWFDIFYIITSLTR
jgi:hypothetical protein